MRHADYVGLLDAGDAMECVFDFGGAHFLAAAFDDIVRACHEVQKAIKIRAEWVVRAQDLARPASFLV